MKHFLFLSSLAAFTTVISGRAYCDACFDRICYSKETIFENYPISGQLAVDRGENIVYFHYEDHENHTLGYDLVEKTFLYLPGIQFSFAKTVDESTRDVYVADTKGILKYSPIINATIRFGLFNETISHMQYKDKIYYTISMRKGLFTFDEQSQTIGALKDFYITEFIVDKRDDIYFTSEYVLYCLRKGDTKPSLTSYIIYSLATDINDNAYFIQRENRGLYKIDYRTGKLNEEHGIGAFTRGSPYTVVFDNYNNLIYFDNGSDKLLYLKPNYARCNVTSEGIGKAMRKKVTRY